MNKNATLNIILFNVGHGDQILLELPDGTYGIIDSYYDPSINPRGEPPALTYLRGVENPVISFFIFTSYHYSHLRGLKSWLSWLKKYKIEINNLWLPSAPSLEIAGDNLYDYFYDEKPKVEEKKRKEDLVVAKKLKEYGKEADSTIYKFQQLIEKSKRKQSVKKSDIIYHKEIIQQDDEKPISLTIYCIAPSEKRTESFNKLSKIQMLEYFLKEKNNSLHHQKDISTILMITFGPFSLLFGGDAIESNIKESIEFLNQRNGIPISNFSSDFVKVFNHDAFGSADSEVWKQILKEKTYLGLTAGKKGRFIPPYPLLVKTLKGAEEKGRKFKLYATTHPIHEFDIPFANVDETHPVKSFKNESVERDAFIETRINLLEKAIVGEKEKLRDWKNRDVDASKFIGFKYIFDRKVESVKVIGLTFPEGNDTQ